MPFPLIPVAIGVLTAGAYWRNRTRKHGIMTEERQKVFGAALGGGVQNPDNLEKLAKSFEDNGLPEQGALLRQRASLQRLPNEVKLARRKAWRKAIKSQNKPVMIEIADLYEREGCTSAAMRLREIISGMPDVIPDAAPVAETPTEETPAADAESTPPEEQPEA